MTKREHYLTETIPAGPGAWELAEQTRTKLLNQVNERRNPRTSSTVTQLLRRYLDQWAGERTTLKNYRRYVGNHVELLIGHVKVGTLDADMLDSFYAELRRCRVHCSGKARGQVDHRSRCEQRAAALGIVLTGDEFVFSPTPDGSQHLKPASLGQRYGRLAIRLGIKTSLHKLRHYSATELIKAGVDIRTVAGRLGHGGGGATTLRIYTAWVSESDQRASLSLHAVMPARPVAAQGPQRVLADPKNPYERIAAALYAQIAAGGIEVGAHLPDGQGDLRVEHRLCGNRESCDRAPQRMGAGRSEPGSPSSSDSPSGAGAPRTGRRRAGRPSRVRV
ncbi:MAG TPA: tyrosine-type recombinase/integrase [Pseudonocardia sp.]|nr:tyrosine-type recombinase/integrase [Pseudonocardia sp.]